MTKVNQSRRNFVATIGKGALLLPLASTPILMSGCNVFTDIENWVPVGISTFSSIVTLLEGAGVINPVAGAPISAIINTINAGFSQIIADVKAYQSITPPPVGALAKLQTILQIVETNMQAFLASINISDNKLLLLVTGLAQIILSTIAGFINSLPASAGFVMQKSVRVSGQLITVTPKLRSIRGYKKDWNKVCTANGHPEMQQHLSFLEHF